MLSDKEKVRFAEYYIVYTQFPYYEFYVDSEEQGKEFIEFSKRSLYPLTRNKELFLEGVERRMPEIVFIGGLTPVERGVIQASGYSIIEA